MITNLKLLPAHYQTMKIHVAGQAPQEACGLLAGKDDSVEAVLKIRNAAQSPVRFRMDPQEQYNAFEWIEVNGLDLVGIYHSHPSGPEIASATDIAENAYEVINIIWSHTEGNWSARAFWIEAGKATEATLKFLKNQ